MLVLLLVTILGVTAPALFRYAAPTLGYGLLVAAVLAHCGLAVLDWHGRAGPKLIYLIVQTLLALSIVYLGRGYGAIHILTIPLAAQVGLGLERRPAWIFGAFLVLLDPVPPLLYGARLDLDLLVFTVAVGTGVCFGLMFAMLVRREQDARQELAQLNDQLRLQAEQGAALAAAEERNRIAREIHDGLGHTLTTVQVQLEAAERIFARDPERARQAVHTAREVAAQGLCDVRQSVASLREDFVPEGPLPELLQQMVERAQGGGLAVEFEIEGAPRELDPRQRTTLFRATQEALTNVRKHGAAHRARLCLRFGSEAVQLAVENPLPDPPRPQGTPGFGLLGLRERARQVNGQLATHTDQGLFHFQLDLPTA